jgi:hypothetical protein
MSKACLALLATLCLAGCQAPIHLGGEFRPRSHDLVSKSAKVTILEEERWVFFWGLVDTGDLDVNRKLERRLRNENECWVDLDVREDITIGGLIIAWFTGGIVSHHDVVIRGKRATRAPGEPERTGPWETMPDDSSRSPRPQPD